MENKDKKMEEMKTKSTKCVKELFGFEKLFFTTFLTYIHAVAQIFVFLGYMYCLLSSGDILKILGGIVIYPIVFFVIRFGFEFLSVQFSINENLVQMKEKLKK